MTEDRSWKKTPKIIMPKAEKSTTAENTQDGTEKVIASSESLRLVYTKRIVKGRKRGRQKRLGSALVG